MDLEPLQGVFDNPRFLENNNSVHYEINDEHELLHSIDKYLLEINDKINEIGFFDSNDLFVIFEAIRISSIFDSISTLTFTLNMCPNCLDQAITLSKYDIVYKDEKIGKRYSEHCTNCEYELHGFGSIKKGYKLEDLSEINYQRVK
ncbi:MAG: hypothetical protein ACFE9L_00220 [Candidatus Hodarchaeota archaeon]